MTKSIRNMIFGLTMLSTAVFSEVSLDWTHSSNLEVYWFESDGTHLERGSGIRKNSDLEGEVNSTDEELERVSKTWIPSSNFLLNMTDGTWHTANGSNEYNITTTTETHDTFNDLDGSYKLTGKDDLAGHTEKASECFDIDVTFSSGAMRFRGDWKGAEKYELHWVPGNWQTHDPYTTMESFVEEDQPFLWSRESGENAGFKFDAVLSDGSGDLVVVRWDENGTMHDDGRKIGTWSTFTLPGQSSTSVKLTITEQSFLDEDEDFKFVTLEQTNTNVVWIGGHVPAGEWEAVPEKESVVNSVAYGDYMAAIAPHDFSKLVNCDLIDTIVDVNFLNRSYQTWYYGDMNFVSIDITNGQHELFAEGTWSVKDGIIIRDAVKDDINKTVTTDEVNAAFQNLTHNITGRGTLLSVEGQLPHPPVPAPNKTEIHYHVLVENVKGKKINMTYEEDSESHTGDIFFFPNMTFSIGSSGEDVGVWRVENGVIMMDSYWKETATEVRASVETWVFGDATHAKVYVGHKEDATIEVNSIASIETSDTLPAGFTADPVTYPFSIDDLTGKLIVVGDPDNKANQDKLYFYANMTFKQETHDDDGNPETITGAWSVEEGAIVVDIVYSDTESSHYVITDNGDDTVRFMKVVSDGSESETIQKICMCYIPSANDGGAVSPSVIMYLLN